MVTVLEMSVASSWFVYPSIIAFGSSGPDGSYTRKKQPSVVEFNVMVTELVPDGTVNVYAY